MAEKSVLSPGKFGNWTTITMVSADVSASNPPGTVLLLRYRRLQEERDALKRRLRHDQVAGW